MAIDPNRVKEVFLEATEQPDETTLAEFLGDACGGDAQLRERVEALLRSHDPSDNFLESPAIKPQAHMSGTHVSRVDQNGTSDVSPTEAEALIFLSPTTRPDSLGRLAHYEILEVLGSGSFGIVYRGFDDLLQRVVAVKVMSPQIAMLSPARKRFLREARSSAAVRHENVVHIYEVGEQPLPYLAMEFIPGQTLQQKLDGSGPLEVVEVLRIGRQIAEGLAAAHASGLIHRDIKPSNILLESGSQKVKITDFGLARAADDASISQSGLIAGTPMFMAPEQALGHHIDQRADLFSLGSVLYQMVSGRPPFRAPSTLAVLKRVAEEPPRPIREIIAEAPDWLCRIISKLHAKNPDDRFASAQQVAELFADCEAGTAGLSASHDGFRIGQSFARSKILEEPHRGKAGRLPGNGRSVAMWIAACVLLLTLVGISVTEFMGVTHLFPRSQKTTVAGESGRTLVPSSASEVSAISVLAEDSSAFKNSIGMEFVVVPKGKSWLRGRKEILGDREVEIPNDFYLGKYEVTQEEWMKLMSENPSHFCRRGDGMLAVKDVSDADLKRFPVEQASWDECQVFIERLNNLEKDSGWLYRLPRMTEWEYACRGGPMSDKSASAFDFYLAKPTNTLLPEQANFDNLLMRTCPVGSYAPNPLGLYDMHGNVAEWNDDFSGESGRALRGGAWRDVPRICEMSFVGGMATQGRSLVVGLRLARVPSTQSVNPALVRAPKPEAAFRNSLGMEFAKVPKGKSWLEDREVEMPADFYLGMYEVTQEEWAKVMGANPSWFARGADGHDAVRAISDSELRRFPVERVSWLDCQAFLSKLNQMEHDAGWIYRLPLEAEWEYACRGGPKPERQDSGFSFYFASPTKTVLPGQANFKDTRSLNRTCEVGLSEANSLGLFDMHGNVWEWCQDPSVKFDGESRGIRSGGWRDDSWTCGASKRLAPTERWTYYDLGFRVARVPSGVDDPK